LHFKTQARSLGEVVLDFVVVDEKLEKMTLFFIALTINKVNN